MGLMSLGDHDIYDIYAFMYSIWPRGDDQATLDTVRATDGPTVKPFQ